MVLEQVNTVLERRLALGEDDDSIEAFLAAHDLSFDRRRPHAHTPAARVALVDSVVKLSSNRQSFRSMKQ